MRISPKKPRILLTGGNGFIGKSFIKSYKNNFQFTIIDNDQEKPFDHPNTIRRSILDFEELSDDIGQVDGIIHLASVSRVISAETNVSITWETNVLGTQKIIDFISHLKTKPWLIYGSSREVYGEPNKFPVDEYYPCNPINRYGISKLAAELIILNAANTFNFPCSILRFSNVYGNTFDHLDRVIPKFILRGLRGLHLELQGSSNTFDFTHISDTIRAIYLTIKYFSNAGKDKNGLILNICTGQSTSLEKLADLIIRTTKSNSTTINAEPRSYDVKQFKGSYDRAHKSIGYRPTVGLQEGLLKLVEQLNNCSEITLKV